MKAASEISSFRADFLAYIKRLLELSEKTLEPSTTASKKQILVTGICMNLQRETTAGIDHSSQPRKAPKAPCIGQVVALSDHGKGMKGDYLFLDFLYLTAKRTTITKYNKKPTLKNQLPQTHDNYEKQLPRNHIRRRSSTTKLTNHQQRPSNMPPVQHGKRVGFKCCQCTTDYQNGRGWVPTHWGNG